MRRSCKRSVWLVVTLAMLGLILIGRTAGDSLNLRLAGEWPFSGTMAVLGVPSRGLVFYGSGGGVYVLDASDPANPRQISDGIRTHGIVGALAYDSVAKHLYIAAQHAGLEIWNVVDSVQPFFLGACRTPWNPSAVTLSGSYAYVADRDSGMRIIDVSDPTNPYQVGRFDSPGSAMDVTVSGGLACLADSGALRIVNIVNPASPYETGHCLDSASRVLAVEVRDTFAYVIDEFTGLNVVNIANASDPFRVGVCPSPSHPCDVALKDNYAYVADNFYGYIVVDISNPPSPVRVGGADMGGKWAVSVADTFAYMLGDWLHMYSIRSRITPHELGHYHALSLNGGCAVKGDYAYIGSDVGLLVIGVGDLTNMREVGCATTAAIDIVIRDTWAYSCTDFGMATLSLGNPIAPRSVGYCSLQDWPVRISLSGTLAGVAAQNSVRIVDVSDPTQPTVVGVYDSLVLPTGVVVRDSYAYVSEIREGLRILDISNPVQPLLVGHLQTAFYAHGISLIWPYAYIATGDAGLTIVDVSDPSAPVEAGLYVPGFPVWDIAAQGRYVYITGWNAPIQVLDVANPTAPVVVAYHGDAGRGPFPAGPLILAKSSGLHVYEQSGYGIEESRARDARGDGPTLLSSRLSGTTLVVSFFAPRQVTMDFRLYDLAGRERTELPSARYAQGVHTLALSVTGFSPGVYFLKSNAPMVGSGKVVICK